MFDISDSFMASSKIEISADTDLIFMNFKFKAIKRIYIHICMCVGKEITFSGLF